MKSMTIDPPPGVSFLSFLLKAPVGGVLGRRQSPDQSLQLYS